MKQYYNISIATFITNTLDERYRYIAHCDIFCVIYKFALKKTGAQCARYSVVVLDIGLRWYCIGSRQLYN